MTNVRVLRPLMLLCRSNHCLNCGRGVCRLCLLCLQTLVKHLGCVCVTSVSWSGRGLLCGRGSSSPPWGSVRGRVRPCAALPWCALCGLFVLAVWTRVVGRVIPNRNLACGWLVCTFALSKRKIYIYTRTYQLPVGAKTG
jgi:hypothetical protein